MTRHDSLNLIIDMYNKHIQLKSVVFKTILNELYNNSIFTNKLLIHAHTITLYCTLEKNFDTHTAKSYTWGSNTV